MVMPVLPTVAVSLSALTWLPVARVRSPVPRARLPKVTAALVFMFWMVVTAPAATVKLVALKLAIPFWV